MGYISRPNTFMLFCADFVKADLGIQYPEYKFLPVHNKNKDKTRKEEARVTMEDERRCSFCWRGRKGRSYAERLVLVQRCLYTNNNTSSIRIGGRRAFRCRTTITLRSAV